jgi:iron complex outermembrane recepter protein
MQATVIFRSSLLQQAIATSALLISTSNLHAADAPQGTRFVVGAVEEIVVTGGAQPIAAEIPGSVDVISRDQLENEHVNLTMDLFKKVPGVTFSRYNQGTVSMDISIRGFNAEGEIPNTKLLIDGIPSNLHTGLSEMDALFPRDLDHIEVVKGTNDPRYGLLNIAGNINMYTRRDDAAELELLAGSFGTHEVQGYLGRTDGQLSHQYFIGSRETDGYRDHSSLDKTSFSGRWFYQASEQLTVGLIARYFEFDADAPGYLSRADARAMPELSYAFSNTDGGSKDTDHLSLHADYTFSDTLDWSLKAYTQNFSRQRFVRFTAAGSQQERVEDEDQNGVITTLSWQAAPSTLVNWGMDYQQQDNTNQRFATALRQRTGALLRNQQFDYDNYGTYVQVQQDITSQLRVVAGLRADRVSGDFLDRRSGAQRDMNGYGTAVQPKLSVLYDVNDKVGVFANAGRSFQAGIGASAYKLPSKPDVDVSDNDGWELGLNLRPTSISSVRLALWQQTAKDELAPKSDNSGDFENVGETTRDGWELTFGLRPTESWYFWGSYSDQQAELTNPGATNAAIRGNALHHVPDYTASLGAEYLVTPKLKATLFSNWQDDYFLDNSNRTGSYGGFALTDFTLSYSLERVDINFRVNNVFDEYYEYAWHDGAVSLHSPGAERSFDASVSMKF